MLRRHAKPTQNIGVLLEVYDSHGGLAVEPSKAYTNLTLVCVRAVSIRANNLAIRVFTKNVQTISTESRFSDVEAELEETTWDILACMETWRQPVRENFTLNNKHLFLCVFQKEC